MNDNLNENGQEIRTDAPKTPEAAPAQPQQQPYTPQQNNNPQPPQGYNPQQGYANNGQTPYQNGTQQPYGYPPQNPNPNGNPGGNPYYGYPGQNPYASGANPYFAPQQPAKPPKQKKPKVKHPTKNPSVKIAAIVISIVVILTAGGLGGYFIFRGSNNSSVSDNGNAPSFNIQDTPADQNASGGTIGEKMTTGQIYNAVEPSVVGIAVYDKKVTYELQGQGSGVIFDKNGYIITNAHVVTDSSTSKPHAKTEVILSTGETYNATVVGYDIESDLAVIKISAENLKAATFGDSSKASVGDDTFVIGNPQGIKFAGSLTKGIISALNRNIYVNSIGSTMEYIQTDAAINPGNSGGAMVNSYGQVIGITSAKISDESTEGMGFAIPINNAKPIVEEILKTGKVSEKGYIGINYIAVSDSVAEVSGIPKGIRVVEVSKGSDASQKGVMVGDIIYEVEGKTCYDTETVSAAMRGKKVGDSIALSIYRVDQNGKEERLKISVKLGEKQAE